MGTGEPITHPPAFRFRRGTSADLSSCVQMLLPEARLEDLAGRLVQIWRGLVDSETATFTVVEDVTGSHPRNIEGFGMSLFVTPEFAAHPRPYFSADLYRRLIAGESILLTPDRLGSVNWTTGIDVVILHFGLRHADLDDVRTYQVLVAGSAGFYFFHSGYRVNSISYEVYGSRAARFTEAAGFRCVRRWAREQPDGFRDMPEEHHPFLMMASPELVGHGSLNPMSQLFSPLEPVIGFSAIERRLLELALLDQTDPEIAASLGLSMATIKKAWATVFDRVGRRAPYVIPVAAPGVAGQRGPEKRRHLLGYLRSHLEELRPGRPRSLQESRSGSSPVRSRA